MIQTLPDAQGVIIICDDCQNQTTWGRGVPIAIAVDASRGDGWTIVGTRGQKGCWCESCALNHAPETIVQCLGKAVDLINTCMAAIRSDKNIDSTVRRIDMDNLHLANSYISQVIRSLLPDGIGGAK